MDRTKDFDAARKLLRAIDKIDGGNDGKAIELIAEYLTDARIDAAPTIINCDPKHPPPPGLLQGIKALTEDEQDQLEVIRSLRMRNASGLTQFELGLLLELADRLPREPRKKTLGQVLYEKGEQSKRYGWETLDPGERATQEDRARAVIEEYEKRRAG